MAEKKSIVIPISKWKLKKIRKKINKLLLKHDAKLRKRVDTAIGNLLDIMDVWDDIENEDGTTTRIRVTKETLPLLSTERMLEMTDMMLKELEGMT